MTMTTGSDKLNRLRIGFECQTSWDGMQGDGCRRFCAQCQRQVFDFAQMTPREIRRRIEASRGRVCGRLTRSDGRLVVARPPEPVDGAGLWATRRASPIAATLVSAWLTAASAEARPAEDPATLIVAVPDQAGGEGARQSPEGTAQAGTSVAADGTDSIDVVADLLEEELTVTAGGIAVATPEPLRRVFDESTLVIMAVAGSSLVHERESEIVEVATELRIETLFKGTVSGRTVTYLHSEYLEESEPSEKAFADLAPGTRVVAFLEPSEQGPDRRGRPTFESANYSFGVKQLGEAERAAYVARLEALVRLERRAEWLGDVDPAELAEWLVGTVEDPHTRGEATAELSEALDALRELAAKEGTTSEIAAQELQAAVDRLRREGSSLPEESAPAVVGASVTEDEQARLTAALGSTEGMRYADLALFRLVRSWDEEAAMVWLARQLSTAELEPEDSEALWRLIGLAEDLKDEALIALAEAAEARAEEIEELWPEDETEETEKLRQEKLAALYQELREDFAEALAGQH